MSNVSLVSTRILLHIGCIVCALFSIVCATIDDHTTANSRVRLSRFVRRSMIDFPTLFYPGPDNKFVTLAPQHAATSMAGDFGAKVLDGSNSKPVVSNAIQQKATWPLDRPGQQQLQALKSANAVQSHHAHHHHTSWTAPLAHFRTLPHSEDVVARTIGAREQQLGTANVLQVPFVQAVQRHLSSDKDSTSGRQPRLHNDDQVPADSVNYIPETYEGGDSVVSPTIRFTKVFSCSGLKPGYYADLSSGCKAFYICHHGRQHSFRCAEGTRFNQQLQVCDWPRRVTCPSP